jgi:hypothetical protein
MQLEPLDLGSGVLLFKNVLKDPKKVYDFILDSKTNNDPFFGQKHWHDWQPWGNYAKAYPASNNEWKTSQDFGAELQRECLNIFFNILKIYKEKYLDHTWFEERNYDKDIPTSYEELELRTSNGNSNHTIADLVVFETNKNVVDDWQMNIHQDTTFWWGESPSHMFNFNIYVNDDYEGGEITFFDSKKAEKVEYKDSYSGKPAIAWVVDDYSTYKMQAGDGLIFPVDVYHGVLPIKNGGEKYYVRQFLSSNANESKINKERSRFNSDSEFDEYFQEEDKKFKKGRITPKIFESLDVIDLDHPKYEGHTDTKVPLIIRSYKDLTNHG